MDHAMRSRLKDAITASPKTFKQISVENGWPETYVSRIVTGETQRPDLVRLNAICKSINVSIEYVFSGLTERVGASEAKSCPATIDIDLDVISQVNAFVKDGGLSFL